MCVKTRPCLSACGSRPLCLMRSARVVISSRSSSGVAVGDGIGDGICGNIV